MLSYQKKRERDPEEAEIVLSKMARLISDGCEEAYVWEELRSAIRDRKALVDSEHGRLKDLEQMITVEKAMSLFAQVVAIHRKYIFDPLILSNIASDLSGLTSGRDAEANRPVFIPRAISE